MNLLLAFLLVAGALVISFLLYLKTRGSAFVLNDQTMASALNHVGACIYVKDRQRRYIYANRAMLELLGTDDTGLRGSLDERYFSPETVQRIRESDDRVLKRGESTKEEIVVGKDSAAQSVVLELKHPLFDKHGRITGVVGVATDVTELHRLRQELEHQARIDALTGIPNRRAFFECAESDLAQARRHGRPLSMLLLDVDHFKQINDRFGHPVGDRVLMRVARDCHVAIRDVDRIGRIGGEEFAILLPETGAAEALEIAERVRTSVQAIQLQNEVVVTPTISLGVATLLPEEQSVHDLYQRADRALYQAKSEGRDRVVMDENAR